MRSTWPCSGAYAKAHVDDRAIGSLVPAYDHLAHAGQARQCRLELAERLDARERSREQGHGRARRRGGLGRGPRPAPARARTRRATRASTPEPLAELGERLDLVAGSMAPARRDRRRLARDRRRFGGRWRRWRLRGGRLRRRLGRAVGRRRRRRRAGRGWPARRRISAGPGAGCGRGRARPGRRAGAGPTARDAPPECSLVRSTRDWSTLASDSAGANADRETARWRRGARPRALAGVTLRRAPSSETAISATWVGCARRARPCSRAPRPWPWRCRATRTRSRRRGPWSCRAAR